MPLGARDVLLMLRAEDQASHIIRQVGGAFRGLGDDGANTGARMMGIGSGMMAFGTGLTVIGGAALAGFNAATDAAIEYEKQAALTLTQTHNLGIGLEEIKDIGIRVARDIPAPFEEMQAGLFDIFSSMSVNAQQAEVILRGIAKGAVAGQTDVQTAGRATIAILNGFKIPAEEVNRVLDIQFELVRAGVGTYEEFASTIGRAIPSAERAGQTVETLAGMMAFLTRNGQSAAMAGTASARAFDLMSNPIFAKNMDAFGIAVYDAQGKTRPMVDVIADLRDKMQGMSEQEASQTLKDLTFGAGGTIQAMRFLNLAVTDTNGLFPELVARMYEAEGAMDQAFNTMAGTSAIKLQDLKNQMEILKVEIGDGLIPVKLKLMEILMKVLKWWNNLDDGTKDLIVKFGLIAAAVAFLGGLLIAGLGSALMVVGGIMIATGASFMGAVAIIGAVIAAMVALVAAIFGVSANWSTFKEAAVDAWDTIKAAVEEAWATLQEIWANLYAGATEVWNNIKANVEQTVGSLRDTINEIFSSIRDWWAVNGEQMITTVVELWNTLVTNVLAVWTPFKEAIGRVMNAIMFVIQTVLQAISVIWDAVGNDILSIVSRVFTMVTDVIRGVMGIVFGIIQAGLALINGDWRKAWDGIKQVLSSTWEIIKTVISNGFAIVVGIVKAAIDLIIAPFKWLYNVIVGNSIIPDLINAIVSWFAGLPGKVLAFVQNLVSTAVSKFTEFASSVVRAVSGLIGNIVTFFAELPGKVIGALGNLATMVYNHMRTGFNRMLEAAQQVVGNLITEVGKLPGKIVGALGDVGSMLFNAGKSIIQGLINGIGSMAGAVVSKVGGILSSARDLLPFSPAKKGPFSGRGWTTYSGAAIMQGLVQGIQSQQGAVQAALYDALGHELPTGDIGLSGTSSGLLSGTSGSGIMISEGAIQLTVQGSINEDVLPQVESMLAGALEELVTEIRTR